MLLCRSAADIRRYAAGVQVVYGTRIAYDKNTLYVHIRIFFEDE